MLLLSCLFLGSSLRIRIFYIYIKVKLPTMSIAVKDNSFGWDSGQSLNM